MALHSNPVITLVTDYGTTDGDAAVVAYALAAATGGAQVVELSHTIDPFDEFHAGFVLGEHWQFFPTGSVHILLIGEGQGPAGNWVWATAKGHHFIAQVDSSLRVALGNDIETAHNLQLPSRIWMGRDALPGIAAMLLHQQTPPVSGPLELPAYSRQMPKISEDRQLMFGAILHINRFGNAVTNIRREDVEAFAPDGKFTLAHTTKERLAPAQGYQPANKGVGVLMINAGGWLEIGVNFGALPAKGAANLFALQRFQQITLSRT